MLILDVGNSPIGDVLEVAAFLIALFPGLRSVSCVPVNDLNSGWPSVKALLQKHHDMASPR
jgi:hypothetical protein